MKKVFIFALTSVRIPFYKSDRIFLQKLTSILQASTLDDKSRVENNESDAWMVRNLKGIDKSPLSRGRKLWDMIPEDIQKSLTRVKFKRELANIKLA